MVKRGYLLLICLGIAGVCNGQTDSAATLQQAWTDLHILCADSLAGRGYTHDGHTKAAAYVQRRFLEIGLHTWQQSFNFEVNFLERASLEVLGGELEQRQLDYGKDYLVAAYSAPLVGQYELIDLGYGLLDDWRAHLQHVRGKVVIVREGLPPDHGLPDSLANQFRDDGFKLGAAMQLKAAGVIILRKKLTGAFSTVQYPIAVLEILSKEMAWPAGWVRLKADISPAVQTVTSQNIVAFLPGLGSGDTTFVISAHYDHLGRVNQAIFSGASDNASGVAFLLALAARLKVQPPHYNILFLATGAEEVGLLGATAYVESLSLRRDTVTGAYVAGCLNFDLMGNGQDGLVAVAGQDYPMLYNSLKSFLTLELPRTRISARSNRPNSDHWAFTQAGIPALFWYTEGGIPNYHDIYDRPDQLELPVFWPLLRSVDAFLHQQNLTEQFENK